MPQGLPAGPSGWQYGHWPETGFWEIDPALSPRVYLSDASGLVVAAALVARHLSKRIYLQATQPLYHLPPFRELAINFLSSLSNVTKKRRETRESLAPGVVTYLGAFTSSL